ncbi:hypothetical protein KEJ14_06380 [Candidatus Bathyarchaeota archaeon]|nr:hypothetical protein [Candidatus Bathyarchaeota archaeon]
MSRKASSIINALRKITKYRPSQNIIAISLVIVAIFLFGGGIYNVVIRPESAIIQRTGISFFLRSIHEQLLGESIIIMMLYAMGVAGLILIYRSSRFRRNPGQASLLLRIGMVLLIMSFIIIEATLYLQKIGT